MVYPSMFTNVLLLSHVKTEQLLFCAITHRSDQLLYSALFYDIDFFFATQGMFLGQVFLGGDSWPRGCEVTSQYCILDGYFSHFCYIVLLFKKKVENNWKRGHLGLKSRDREWLN